MERWTTSRSKETAALFDKVVQLNGEVRAGLTVIGEWLERPGAKTPSEKQLRAIGGAVRTNKRLSRVESHKSAVVGRIATAGFPLPDEPKLKATLRHAIAALEKVKTALEEAISETRRG